MREPTRRQLQAIGFVALLSPATRLLPGMAARRASHAGWLCPILALPLCALVSAVISRALRYKSPGEGLGEVLLRRSPVLGRAALGVSALYLALYAGFAVRSAASRFIYTVYTGSTPWIFVAAGLGAGLLAALGSVKRLARTAELFRPLLLLALLPVLGAAIARLDWGELLPIGVRDIPGMALGALECAGTTGFALTFVPLFETGDAVERRALAMTSWSARMALFHTALIASVLGRFGPELSGEFTYPFFALVRNTGLFGVAERVEAPVTALWVLSDFVLCGLALTGSARLARLALGIKSAPGRPWPLRPRVLTTLAAAAAALACALAAAPDARVLRIVSEKAVVWANLAVIALMLAAALSAGRRGGNR